MWRRFEYRFKIRKLSTRTVLVCSTPFPTIEEIFVACQYCTYKYKYINIEGTALCRGDDLSVTFVDTCTQHCWCVPLHIVGNGKTHEKHSVPTLHSWGVGVSSWTSKQVMKQKNRWISNPVVVYGGIYMHV